MSAGSRSVEASSLPYEVVYWDSEATGYEGDRIRFSERKAYSNEAVSAWRSDRRCIFPLEIGVRMSTPCQLQGFVVTSEPGLAPSALECFVAGPARGAGKSTTPAGERAIEHRGGLPRTVSTGAKRGEYLSSVFVRIGRADFSPVEEVVEVEEEEEKEGEKNARSCRKSGPSSGVVARLAGLSFKGQFLRLVLQEPPGSSANPGRQVSITRIRILGRPLRRGALHRQQKVSGGERCSHSNITASEVAAGELEGVLRDLGIEPMLSHAGGGGPQGSVEEGTRGEVEHDQQAGAIAAPAGAAEATKRVQDMLEIALAGDRLGEAEQLSLSLDRVRALGRALGSARRAQGRASSLEEFDRAKAFLDEAREAEVWLRQAVQDASAILEGRGEGKGEPVKTAGVEPSAKSEGPAPSHEESSSASGGQASSRDSREGAAKGTSSAREPQLEGAGSSQDVATMSTAIDRDEPSSQSMMDTLGGNQPPDGSRFANAVGTSEHDEQGPPWLMPESSPLMIGAWSDLLKLPWPVGIVPDFGMVFCHKWKTRENADDESGEGRQVNNYYSSYPSVFAATESMERPGVERQQTTARSPRPGRLLWTILRLVAAWQDLHPPGLAPSDLPSPSQDLRPPGPVLPDTVPFRNAGISDGKAPLCLFSMMDGAGTASQKGRAFSHHPETDSSPCATHVTNWIEDNHDLVWNHFASSQYCRQNGHRERGNKGPTRIREEQQDARGKPRYSRTTEGAPNSTTTESVGRKGSEHKQEGANASASRTTAVLPNVVGAGGLADFMPLLDATIGRVPISAACASFPAKMRESSIRLCEAHLHHTADVAIKTCKAAAATQNSTCTPDGDISLSSSCGHVKTMPAPSLPGPIPTGIAQGGQQEANQGLAVASISAVFRAGCIVAAQGLMDPAKGPRSAGTSLAMSVLSLSWLSSWRGVETVNESVNPTGGGNDHPQALTDDDTRGWKNETVGLHCRNTTENGTVGLHLDDDDLSDPIDPNPKKTTAGVPLLLPLRDLRWGLELLLGCVATSLAYGIDGGIEWYLHNFFLGKEGAGGKCVCDSRDSPATDEEGSSRGPTRDGVNDGEIRSETKKGQTARHGKGQENDADALLNTSHTAGENGNRAHTVCRLIDFSCRCAHIGPALVASILVRWIPILVKQGRVTTPPLSSPLRDTTASTSRAKPLSHGPVSVGSFVKETRLAAPATVTINNKRPREVGWRRRGPPGEEAAAGMLAAGATRMLELMLRLDVRLVPLSDFSAETLAIAAEHAMSFGSAHSNADHECPCAQGTNARRPKAECEAQRAGEALMLELVLRHGVGGTVDALLPSLNSARGIACLHEASTPLLMQAKNRAGKDSRRRVDVTMEDVGERGVHDCSFERGTSRGGDVERGDFGRHNLCDKCGKTKITQFSPRTPVGKIHVRQRLEIPQSLLLSTSGDRKLKTDALALGNGNCAPGDVCPPGNGDSEDADDATTSAIGQNRQPDAADPGSSLNIRRKLQEEVGCDGGENDRRCPSCPTNPGSNESDISSMMQSAPKAEGEESADPGIAAVVGDSKVALTRPISGSRRKIFPLNKAGSTMGKSSSSSRGMLEPRGSSTVRETTGSDDDVNERKERGIVHSAASKLIRDSSRRAGDAAQLEKGNVGVNSGNDVADDNNVVAAGIEEKRGGGTCGATASSGVKNGGGGWMKKTLRWFKK